MSVKNQLISANSTTRLVEAARLFRTCVDNPDSEVCLVAEFMAARVELLERKVDQLSGLIRMVDSRPPIPGPPGQRGAKGDSGLHD